MNDTVVFQPPQAGQNSPQKEPIDPFEKYEHMPPVQQQTPPQSGSTQNPSPQPPRQPSQSQPPMQNTPPPIRAGGNPAPTSSPLPPPPPPPPPIGIPGWMKIAGGVIGSILLLIIILSLFRGGKQLIEQNQKVTLEYWELWENQNTMDQLFADFHRKYPNITVNVVKMDPKQYSDRLVTRIKNDNGPDLFSYHNSWIPEFLPFLSPLSTTAISSSDFTKTFYPVTQKDLIHNGAIYGIPLEIDTLALLVNNNILKAAGTPPPTRWDEFNTIASLTTVKDTNGNIKTAGVPMGYYDNIAHASDILAMLFAQNRVDQNNISKTAKNAANALRFYTSFGNVWDTRLDPSLTVFAQGNAAMCFAYSYDIFAIRAMNPTLDFSVHPVPRLADRQITTASYWVQGVSIKSKHQREAMILLNFLAQKDTEEKFYTLSAKTRPFGEPYARMDLADKLKDDPIVYPFIQQAKTAVSTYFSSNTFNNEISAQMNGYIGNAIRSAASNTSAESAIGTLAQGVTQVLQQYGYK